MTWGFVPRDKHEAALARLGETKDALREAKKRFEAIVGLTGYWAEIGRLSRDIASDGSFAARAALLGDDEQAGTGQIPEPPEAASSTEANPSCVCGHTADWHAPDGTCEHNPECVCREFTVKAASEGVKA